MEGTLRGPRRARRLGQESSTRIPAPMHTPEGNHIHTPEGPHLDTSPNDHADLLPTMHRNVRHASLASPATHHQGSIRQFSPAHFPQVPHASFATPDLGNGTNISPAPPTPAVSYQTMEEDDYTSVDDMEEQLNHHSTEMIDEQVEDRLEEDEEEEQDVDLALPADLSALGLKEISNLGKFTVSSHKPGNGVEELRSDDTDAYWQSDGPQPHKLTVYFIKRVGIRDIRFFVDYQSDESYTPTRIVFKAGTSENNLLEFAMMELSAPSGWQQVPVVGAGGGPDGNTLVCYVFQMQILENHQNGKDTHLRGIKIYAADGDSRGARGMPGAETESSNPMAEIIELIDNPTRRRDEDEWVDEDSEMRLERIDRRLRAQQWEALEREVGEPDFMKEPELR
ncbi:APC10-domain-containing protein [Sodiomyces alkalinus F11]|uniref:APC10-domain-containing protein n=1 Tax=Sodiomyces alkalinus (strain CBS 110278 / VKM F-3762 / F11) TaxID=1314773 RepID=A0A3N2Q726_SODAK|nr:APC10-domain-containing protein [Sodiomyces alkalinus F11]ROT42415.1 APC10-domain-containing protein [Sodiomyces alkalinus F11]